MSNSYLAEDRSTVCDPDQISDAPVGSDPHTSPTELLNYSTVEDFVAHVIYDGRFLKTFTVDPQGVAAQLGVIISPEVEETLGGRDRGQVLAEVTEKMTREYGQRSDAQGTIPDIHADFGISTVVVVGAIAIITIVIAGCSRTMVTDDSPDSHLKL